MRRRMSAVQRRRRQIDPRRARLRFVDKKTAARAWTAAAHALEMLSDLKPRIVEALNDDPRSRLDVQDFAGEVAASEQLDQDVKRIQLSSGRHQSSSSRRLAGMPATRARRHRISRSSARSCDVGRRGADVFRGGVLCTLSAWVIWICVLSGSG
jgi:hypothetical protein